ncbi:MAG: hypothetical protein KatS3mg014_1196 [Actinomycetota bacterium]|nr:MAG: hypothetical protein KatS3mg014_1196 [Actinomycetota bacterium]
MVRRSLWAALLAATLLLAHITPAAASLTAADRAERAAGYVASQQRSNGAIVAFSAIGSTADAVVSLVAAGVGRPTVERALDYLERKVRNGKVTGVGLQGKVVLAVVAAGGDPRRFGGTNLVRAIRATEQEDGRLGATTAVFDQALGILALVAAGRTPSDASLTWLLGAQCPDGGWQYDGPPAPGEDEHCSGGGEDWFASDTNTTAMAVMALEAAGAPAPAVDPVGFFEAIRDADRGGWGYTWGYGTTDANSTALVLQAYAALGQDPPTGSIRALRELQYLRCGAFAYSWAGDERTGPNLGATIGAIPGLLRAPFPITGRVARGPAPELPACAA